VAIKNEALYYNAAHQDCEDCHGYSLNCTTDHREVELKHQKKEELLQKSKSKSYSD
jgi:cytochrome c553